MEFRYAAEGDVTAMAALFAANHRDALTEGQRTAHGFVQGTFDAAVLTAMVAKRALLVADDAGRVAGLLGLCPAGEVGESSPPVAGLLAAQGALEWQGRPLSEVRWLLYGPVVVDAAYRGHGVARGLFRMAVGEAAGRAEAVVAFIEDGNATSWKVHVDGFGMTPLGGYVAAGRSYTAVAAPVGTAV
ncbi:GNAT family N-acetyltransferase [Streptomyces sp. NPDC088762]|uniref:GNAT family N-acetyltransferase n=1 Tax=Streptomyces sp. NPDC088762 TaxID=3365891 RepID=UPI003800F1D8